MSKKMFPGLRYSIFIVVCGASAMAGAHQAMGVVIAIVANANEAGLNMWRFFPKRIKCFDKTAIKGNKTIRVRFRLGKTMRDNTSPEIQDDKGRYQIFSRRYVQTRSYKLYRVTIKNPCTNSLYSFRYMEEYKSSNVKYPIMKYLTFIFCRRRCQTIVSFDVIV